MAWRWYVYEVACGAAIVYVGKGCGERAAQSARRLNGIASKVACFEHEIAALDFERQRIKERLAEGCTLLNITHGNRIAWHRRTDSQQMAREALQEIARRASNWAAAGHLHTLSLRCGIPVSQLSSLIQTYG